MIESMYAYVDYDSDLERLSKLQGGNKIVENIKSKRKSVKVTIGLDNLSQEDINASIQESLRQMASSEAKKVRQEILAYYNIDSTAWKDQINVLLKKLQKRGFIKGEKIFDLIYKEQKD